MYSYVYLSPKIFPIKCNSARNGISAHVLSKRIEVYIPNSSMSDDSADKGD